MEIFEGTNPQLKRYVFKEFMYKRNKVANGVTYLECTEKDCNGRAHFTEGSLPIETSFHCHLPDSVSVDKLKLKSYLIERAGKELTKFRNIYIDGVRNFPMGATRLAYPEALRAMKYFRRKKFPRNPVSLMDIETILNDADNAHLKNDLDGKPFFRRCVRAPDDSTMAIFIAEDMIPMLRRDGVTLLIDDTYKTVPDVAGAYQLMSIHALECDGENAEVFACAFAVMSNKSLPAYVTALNTIANEVGGVSPVRVMCDFDATLREAVRQCFYGVEVSGCWFHFSQAVQRHAVNVDHLRPLINTNENAAIALQRMIALHLVRSDQVRDAFNDTVAFIRAHVPLRRPFENFIAYMERQWFRDFMPCDYSVFGEEVRTNNNVERFHLELLQALGVTHPSFWHFYDGLRKISLVHLLRRRQIATGQIVRRPLRAERKRFNEQIRNLWRDVNNGVVNAQRFIHRAGFFVAGVQRRTVGQGRGQRRVQDRGRGRRLAQ